jgi:hypothetical protein
MTRLRIGALCESNQPMRSGLKPSKKILAARRKPSGFNPKVSRDRALGLKGDFAALSY